MIRFNVPSSIIVGAGVASNAGNEIKKHGLKHVLLVTDSFFVKNGVVDDFRTAMSKQNITVDVFSGVRSDPTMENVMSGLKEYWDSEAQGIVGLGGGSPLDTAKAISMMVTNPEPISQYTGYNQFQKKGVPLFLLPTTAGTGSEVTKVTVITDTEKNVKMMMLDEKLTADAALVDYTYSLSMPRTLTAHVGVDALVHAVEAYVSRKANPITDSLALSAVKLIGCNLKLVWDNPDDKKVREEMMLGSCMAGMAFCNSSVCLVHGMSRCIGANFHTTHGLSNAVIFPTVTEFSLAGAVKRYAEISRVLGASSDADDNLASRSLPGYLEDLNNYLKIPKIRDVAGVEYEDYENRLKAMAETALASGSPQNNPVVPTIEQIIELYKKAW